MQASLTYEDISSLTPKKTFSCLICILVCDLYVMNQIRFCYSPSKVLLFHISIVGTSRYLTVIMWSSVWLVIMRAHCDIYVVEAGFHGMYQSCTSRHQKRWVMQSSVGQVQHRYRLIKLLWLQCILSRLLCSIFRILNTSLNNYT